MLQKAVDWSISFAAGSNARKTAFLQDISQGKDKEFLRDVLNTYRSNNESADLRGRCGYSIGSREYLNYVERKVLLQDLPAIYSDDYDGGIKGSLEDIVRQLQRIYRKTNERTTISQTIQPVTCVPLLANWNTAGSAQVFLTA